MTALPASVAFDDVARTVRFAGRECRLSQQQWTVLAALRERPGQVVSRTTLLDRLYAADPDGGPLWGEKVVDVAISYVRAALRELGAPLQVDVLRGVGWGLVPA